MRIDEDIQMSEIDEIHGSTREITPDTLLLEALEIATNVMSCEALTRADEAETLDDLAARILDLDELIRMGHMPRQWQGRKRA